MRRLPFSFCSRSVYLCNKKMEMDSKQKTSIYSIGWPKDLVRPFCKTAEQESRVLRELNDAYAEPHRYYHTAQHLVDMRGELRLLGRSVDRNFESGIDVYDTRNPIHDAGYRRQLLELAILYHDVVYEPFRKDNEEVSCHVFETHFGETMPRDAVDEVCRLIMLTKEHTMPPKTDPLGQLMVYLDMMPLRMPFSWLLRYERQIMREFQAAPYEQYREERLKVLYWLLEYDMELYPSKKRDADLKALYDYVYAYRPKIGLYAYTFDPFHIGHMDVLRKAEKVFDKVVIFVGVNNAKTKATLQGTVNEALPYHQKISSGNLLIDELRDRVIPPGYYEIRQCRSWEANPKGVWSMRYD